MNKFFNTYVVVDMPDGTVWKIPAMFIARHRAEYYIDRDITTGYIPESEREQSIYFEMMYVLEDDPGMLLDWAQNNMDWSDVEHSASRCEDKVKAFESYSEAWSNAPMEIVNE